MRLFLARFCSVLFLPILIPVFASVLVVWSNPYAFGGWRSATFFILQVAIWTFLIPAIALLIMKQLELIKDLNLSERTDRIIPYMVIMVCYTIAFYAIFKLPIPNLVKAMVVGSLLSIIVSFFLNNFLKISAHANGMGSFVGVILGLTAISIYNVDWLLVIAVIATGLVLSARIYLKAHTLKEVFMGFAVGFMAQLIAIIAFDLFYV